MENIKILAIDDEEVVRFSIKKALAYGGYEVVLARGALEGLQTIQTIHPVVIILDLKMPEMDGIQFLEALNLQPEDPYAVIVLTGHGSEEEMSKCYNLGAHLFLRKPFSITEITCHVKRLIQVKVLEAESEAYRKKLEKDIAERIQLEEEKNVLINKLQLALDEVKLLQGIIPICSFCKDIRDDAGYYVQLESYLHKNSGVDFSHTICPKCAEKHYPDLSLHFSP